MTQTTIAVTKETKEMLKSLGEKDDSYDSIINEVASAYFEFLKKQYEILSKKEKFKELKFE